ncbi:MAG: family 10 glycosylhydrolase [Bacteroidaceae bacterium]|nr:family 10 glycosylhydrolase [Bacteroidaceae bacterium]
MKKTLQILLLSLVALFVHTTTQAQEIEPLKREFRGAWIQAVNGQFQNMSEQKMKSYLITMLDNLQKANVNAIIFQVRVEGDALYNSPYEPWTRYITGTQGVSPGWDPLQFMVDEAHKRNMELHAWINPYRARTKGTRKVAATHQSALHPERFISYEGQLYFNPALKENRDHICMVAKDIITRYDVDGLHIDDYFYPYPANGKKFPDDKEFMRSGANNLGDWRRENVNRLILQLHTTVRETKPWVKFGVSPFGIYRNKTEGNPNGSATKGLQSYDDLYADVIHWINEGWVDYCIPQIYWEMGHKAADYETLVHWWAQYASNRPLYIGQDVNRTVRAADPNNTNTHQLPAKMEIQRSESAIQGSCLWDAASAANNVGRYRDVLQQHYHRYPALMPKYPFIDKGAPKKVKGVRLIDTPEGKALVWLKNNKKTSPMNEPWRYVVYCFANGESVDLENPKNIVAITSSTYYKVPANEKGKRTYVVTVLDRMQNESKGAKCKVKK